MYWVYILKSIHKEHFYIGHTNNVPARIKRHNKGSVLSTRVRRPWRVVYQKQFMTRSAAMKYESHLKSLKNKNYLQKIIDAG